MNLHTIFHNDMKKLEVEWLTRQHFPWKATGLLWFPVENVVDGLLQAPAQGIHYYGEGYYVPMRFGPTVLREHQAQDKDHLGCQVLGLLNAGQIFMVCLNSKLGLGTLQPVPPLLQGGSIRPVCQQKDEIFSREVHDRHQKA